MKLIIYFLLLAQTLSAETIKINYEFQKPSVKHGQYDLISIAGLSPIIQPGKPVLPSKDIKILIPAGEKVLNVKLIPCETETLKGYYDIQPGPPIIPTSVKEDKIKTVKDSKIYKQSSPYPGESISNYLTHRLNGFDILTGQIFPVCYIPKTGKILYYKKVTLEITTTPDTKTKTEQSAMRITGGKTSDKILQNIENSEALFSYNSLTKPIPTPGTLASKSGPFDYILITGTPLKDSFQVLVNWKNSRGIQAGLFTTDSIYANYTGVDNQEKIRNFIKACYTTWSGTAHPLKWVALGGDDEIIPVRGLLAWGTDGVGSPIDSTMASDIYYAGLDGNWDTDGDGVYGEGDTAGGGTGTSGEEADFLFEIAVGRITVETPEEAGNYIKKLIYYENRTNPNYFNRALFVGEYLDPYTQGGDKKDSLAYLLLPKFSITRLYDRDETFSSEAVEAELLKGTHILNHLGHANSSEVMNLFGGNIGNADYPLIYSQGCYTAGFDEAMSGPSEAISESFIFSPTGAFAYIGNTRFGWYSSGLWEGPGEHFDHQFLDAIFTENIKNLGDALNDAKEDLVTAMGATGTMRWCYFTINLLGDPETPIITEYLPPNANISSPNNYATIFGDVLMQGTAKKGDAAGATFLNYKIEYGMGKTPSLWVPVSDSFYQPVTNDTLCLLNTRLITEDSLVTIKLIVKDSSGKIGEDKKYYRINNCALDIANKSPAYSNSDTVYFKGNAFVSNFTNYTIKFKKKSGPDVWDTTGIVLRNNGISEKGNDTLGIWVLGQIPLEVYAIKLNVYGSDTFESVIEINIDESGLPGFPVYGGWFGSPTVCDVNLDGRNELLISKAEGLFVYDNQGNKLFNTSSSDWLYGAPSVGDIDGDGDLEMVAAEKTKLYAWHHNGTIVTSFPRSLPGMAYTSPTLCDFNNDSIAEILYCSGDSLYRIKGDGSIVSGWPIYAPGIYKSAVADINGDNEKEIIFGNSLGEVCVIKKDKTTLAGWPMQLSREIGIPAIGDIDNNDSLEIVVPTCGRSFDSIYIFKSDGSRMPGWPKPIIVPFMEPFFQPALGDLNGDSLLEIVMPSTDSLYNYNPVLFVFDYTGNFFPGWPETLSVKSEIFTSAVIGDIYTNPGMEIVVGTRDKGKFYAFTDSGVLIPSFPKFTADSNLASPSPTLADLDNDGFIEIIGSSLNHTYVWNTQGDSKDIEWSTSQNDVWHTGWYKFTPSNPGVEEKADNKFTLSISQTMPNPFNKKTLLSFSVPENANVKINVFNLAGQHIKTLFNNTVKPGTYNVYWYGKDTNENPAPTGIYFIKIEGIGDTKVRKLILLK
ncbi:MAG: C25 family cysteine peptidase [bacterium]|nr:C25 family cysteine peptidase [bacterium]